MLEVTPYLFGISLEVRLRKPRSFSQQRLDALLLRLIDSENGLALRSDQIRLRQHDFAFDYEVRASLLAGNGLLIHDAEKFFLSVSGGRTDADALLLARDGKTLLMVKRGLVRGRWLILCKYPRKDGCKGKARSVLARIWRGPKDYGSWRARLCSRGRMDRGR